MNLFHNLINELRQKFYLEFINEHLLKVPVLIVPSTKK